MTFPKRSKKRARRLYSLFFRLCGSGFVLCALACCAGCAESNARKDSSGLQVDELTGDIATTWFYFDSSGSLVRAENPAAIPSPGFKAWTEAPSVMDAGIADGSPVLLVNKKGALAAETLLYAPSLVTDGGESRPLADAEFAVPHGIFPSASSISSGTLAAFACEDGKTYARFYKSVVFDSDRASQPVALFLCGEGPFFPLESAAFASDFGADENAQCVALLYTKDEPWIAAFKSRVGVAGSLAFEYFALTALPGSAGFSSSKLSSEEFQSLSERARGDALPQAFSSLLALVPATTRVSIKIAGEGFPETCEFVTGGEAMSLSAWGFLFEGGAAVLFSDGTFYFAKENSDVVKSLRFPRLNAGYLYTAFVFSDTGILAGWEERRFYETGRSGIIAVSTPAGFFD